MISVVIPTYNRAKLLKRALNSVFTQTHPAGEVLVIDDASTDETNEILQSYSSKGNIRTIKNKKNMGVSFSRNVGIKNAKYDWIALLDSDDEWLPHKLEAQWKLTLTESVQLVHSNEIWKRKNKVVQQHEKHLKIGGDVFEHSLPFCRISPSASLFTKKIWERVGGFNEEYIVCEDYDFWLKCSLITKAGYVPEPLIIKHGGHGDQLSLKYHSMDYYRIRSLIDVKQAELSTFQLEALNKELLKKLKLFLNGCIKHSNGEKFQELYPNYVNLNGELGLTPDIANPFGH